MSGYDISSTSNEQVKRLVRLRERRHRDREQIFVVEERRILERALASGHRPLEIFASPELAGTLDGLEFKTMSPEALDRASYRKSSTGLIALFGYFPRSLADIVFQPGGLYLVAEGIQKPGNLGALMRICDGAGVAALIVVDSDTDVFNPNAVRASTGAVFTVPVARASMDETSSWLSGHGVRSVAAEPGAPMSIWETDLTGSMAIWVGAEAEGLSGTAASRADQLVRIPMVGEADSLNASVAAAVMIFESIRQRSDP